MSTSSSIDHVSNPFASPQLNASSNPSLNTIPTHHPQAPSLSRPSSITTQFSMILTYKRIILPLFAPPFLSFLAPIVVSKVLSLFNSLSHGCALGSFIASFILINYVYGQVQKYAPSVEKRNEAFDYMKGKFEIVVLVLVSYVMRFVMIISSSGRGEGSWDSYVLQAGFLNVHFGIRIAMGLFVLSVLVGSRFVGYFAIVQCATYPLPNNPYPAILRNLANVDRLLQPDRQLQSQQQQPRQQEHRRPLDLFSETAKKYAKPTIAQTLIQVLIHLIAGFIVGSIILPHAISTSPHDTIDSYQSTCQSHVVSDLQYLFLVACAITCAVSFMVPYYSTNEVSHIPTQCNYHELSFDKKTLPYIPVSSLWSVIYHDTMEQIKATSVLFYWIINPVISAAFINILKGSNLMTALSNECPGTRRSLFSAFMVSYVTTLIICLYIMVIDISARKFLTTRGLDIFKLLSQSNISFEDRRKDRSNITGLDTATNDIDVEKFVVNVILVGLGSGIVNEVLCPRIIEKDGQLIRPVSRRNDEGGNTWVPSSTHSFSNVDVEKEEVRRNNLIIQKVAASILTGSIGSYSTFEEDLLKGILLESIGGDDCDGPTKEQTQNISTAFGLSVRHYKTLLSYLDQTSGSSEILSIIRALCAYAGGTGEALIRISRNSPITASRGNEQDTFSFHPFAALSGMHAIKAASRLVLLNMNNQRALINRLSLFIPVILQTSFTLRCGVLDYAQYLFDASDPSHHSKGDARGENFSNFVTMKYPEMAKVLKACDECSSKILHLMKKIEGRNLEISEIKVNENVKEWLLSLL